MRGAGSFFAQHVEREMTRERHFGRRHVVHHCLQVPANPPVEEELQERAPLIVILFFGGTGGKRAEHAHQG